MTMTDEQRITRKQVFENLKEQGLIDEVRQMLLYADEITGYFLRFRRLALEALFRLVKAIPPDLRHDRWLWRLIMREIDPSLLNYYWKSLRHLSRLVRKLASITTDDDTQLVRAISVAYDTGVLKFADRLSHSRKDGLEREVAEMLSKLAAYYASGETWILGRLRELMEELEAHWQKRFR